MTPVECRFRGKAKRRRDHRRVVAVCGRQPKGSESEPLELSPITLKDIGDKKLSARARKLGERRRDHPTDQELFSGAAAPIIIRQLADLLGVIRLSNPAHVQDMPSPRPGEPFGRAPIWRRLPLRKCGSASVF